jgi:hypothetical protein
MTDRSTQVGALLHEAGETHHLVYRIVDGDDPDFQNARSFTSITAPPHVHTNTWSSSPGAAREAADSVLAVQAFVANARGDPHVGAAGLLDRRSGAEAVPVQVGVAGAVRYEKRSGSDSAGGRSCSGSKQKLGAVTASNRGPHGRS